MRCALEAVLLGGRCSAQSAGRVNRILEQLRTIPHGDAPASRSSLRDLAADLLEAADGAHAKAEPLVAYALEGIHARLLEILFDPIA